MADIKVSELIETQNLNNADLVMIVQNGTNKKVKASKFKEAQSGGTVLYESNLGTIGDVTLEEIIDDYRYIEVIGDAFEITTVNERYYINELNDYFTLSVNAPSPDGSEMAVIGSRYQVDGNKLLYKKSSFLHFANGTWTNQSSSYQSLSPIKIFKVIGYN